MPLFDHYCNIYLKIRYCGMEEVGQQADETRFFQYQFNAPSDDS